MKNLFPYLLFIWVAALPACGREPEHKILLDAELWSISGDTIRGKILYLNQFNCQFNITLTDTSGNELAFYAPKDLKGYCYKINDERIEFISLQNPMDMGRVFLRVLHKGYFTLYQFLEMNYKSSVLSFISTYFLWHDEWIDPPISQEYELESLLAHFADCPELEYKIKTRQYTLTQIRDIITEYENCRLTDRYEFFYE